MDTCRPNTTQVSVIPCLIGLILLQVTIWGLFHIWKRSRRPIIPSRSGYIRSCTTTPTYSTPRQGSFSRSTNTNTDEVIGGARSLSPPLARVHYHQTMNTSDHFQQTMNTSDHLLDSPIHSFGDTNCLTPVIVQNSSHVANPPFIQTPICNQLDPPQRQTHSFVNAIDKLEGDEQNIDDWFDIFEAVAVGNSWSNSQKCAFIAIFVRGRAKAVYSRLPDSSRRDYNFLRRDLLARLRTKTQADEQAEFFSRKQQTDESIDQYIEELRRLANRSLPELTHPMREQVLLRSFTNGVRADVRKQLAVFKYATVDEAVEAARRVDLVTTDLVEQPVFYIEKTKFAPKRNVEHKVDVDNATPRFRFDGICNYPPCQKRGHKEEQCYMKKRHAQNAASMQHTSKSSLNERASSPRGETRR